MEVIFMKRTVGLLVSAAAILLSSCGTTARYASSDNGQRFQDGIYGTTPSFRTKAEKELGKQAADALIEKTQASEIYLFGDKKDTVIIPDNMAAKIKLNTQEGTSVTVVNVENLYEWDFYNPYDIRNSYWYGYGPYYSWTYSPWRYRYDPWYYGFSPFYRDPWYYGHYYYGFYDPFYYDPWYGFRDPWYYHHHGWYDPFYHDHHHHHPAPPKRDVYHGSRANAGFTQAGSGRVSANGGSSYATSQRVAGTSRSEAAGASRSGAVRQGSSAPVRQGAASTNPTRVSSAGRTGASASASRVTSATRTGSTATRLTASTRTTATTVRTTATTSRATAGTTTRPSTVSSTTSA